jgi:hypothetical protein
VKYNHSIGLFVIFGLFFFWGCGDDEPTGPGLDGTFTATISGDMSKSFSGNAWFWSGVVEGETGFVLWLFSDSDNQDMDEAIWFAREGTTRPGTGQYVISNYQTWGDDNWNPQHFTAWFSQQGTQAWSVAGSLTITTSASNRFAGSFQFQATGYTSQNVENEISLTISGEFDAVGTEFNM